MHSHNHNSVLHTMMSLKMSNLPSFCQDRHCNLSANLLQLMDGMIHIMIFCEEFLCCRTGFSSVILTGNYQEECSEILYDFIFTDTGEQIMGRPSRPACFTNV